MKPILIAGPTASGKSALALELAGRTGALVVNVDSQQVYRDLRVLTARPTPEDEARAEHRLFGHVDGAVNHSVARHVAEVAAVLAEGRPAILVGGTGLYLRALLEGLSEVPPVPEAVREAVRRAAEGRPTPALHRELAQRDPASAAEVGPNDRLRTLRALEVLEATGRPLRAWRAERRPGPLADRDTVRVFLAPERDALRRRIDDRFRAMIAAGALDEVAALRRRQLDPALPLMRAHGVPALMAHLDGRIGLEEAITRGQADTRAYAKRQFTWFRHQMPGWTWLTPGSLAELTEAVARLASTDPAQPGTLCGAQR